MSRHPTLDEIEGGASFDGESAYDEVETLRIENAKLRIDNEQLKRELMDANDEIVNLRDELEGRL